MNTAESAATRWVKAPVALVAAAWAWSGVTFGLAWQASRGGWGESIVPDGFGWFVAGLGGLWWLSLVGASLAAALLSQGRRPRAWLWAGLLLNALTFLAPFVLARVR